MAQPEEINPYSKEDTKIALKEILSEEEILFDEPLKDHTTFRIGGPADFFVMPHSYEQAAHVIRYCRDHQIPYFFLGNGSNLLVGDEGYRGVILQVFHNMSEIAIEGTLLTAKAGALLSKVANLAAQEGLSGLEFASGIPGTVGGAVVMNAGAYGGEMKDVVKKAVILTPEGTIRELTCEQLKFGYRKSCIEEEHALVLSVEMELLRGNKEEILEKMDGFRKSRIEKQPLEYPSAGSTFKRPEGYYAGKLIMDSGLRGYRYGGAMVSEKHCGFVINAKDATSEDVKQLIKNVQDKVQERFGVKLETEVKFLGN